MIKNHFPKFHKNNKADGNQRRITIGSSENRRIQPQQPKIMKYLNNTFKALLSLWVLSTMGT